MAVSLRIQGSNISSSLIKRRFQILPRNGRVLFYRCNSEKSGLCGDDLCVEYIMTRLASDGVTNPQDIYVIGRKSFNAAKTGQSHFNQVLEIW
jgi:hypothetical protein